MESITTIRDLRVGDVVLHHDGSPAYEVLEVLRDEPEERVCRIRWNDGGHDIRAWDGLQISQRVSIRREQA